MKMCPLPVEKLFMVGSKTKSKLNGRGIYTIGELARLDKEYIYNWLKKSGLLIWEYANGIENSPVRTTEPLIKSLSNSTATPRDIGNRVEANLVLLGISEMLGMKIRALNMYGPVVSVVIKDNNFIIYRKQKSLYIPTNLTDKIYDESKDLFNSVWKEVSLRQFSISISGLDIDILLVLVL